MSVKKFLVSCLVFSCFLSFVHSFSVGVPPTRTVCRGMVPGHDKYRPQEKEPPFQVTTDVKSVNAGGQVDITLLALGSTKFQGFYMQARDKNDVPVGRFNPNTLAKAHSCGGIRRNAIHHASSAEKNLVNISWEAPQNYAGPVNFTATFVENYVTFWTKVQAEPVEIINN